MLDPHGYFERFTIFTSENKQLAYQIYHWSCLWYFRICSFSDSKRLRIPEKMIFSQSRSDSRYLFGWCLLKSILKSCFSSFLNRTNILHKSCTSSSFDFHTSSISGCIKLSGIISSLDPLIEAFHLLSLSIILFYPQCFHHFWDIGYMFVMSSFSLNPLFQSVASMVFFIHLQRIFCLSKRFISRIYQQISPWIILTSAKHHCHMTSFLSLQF